MTQRWWTQGRRPAIRIASRHRLIPSALILLTALLFGTGCTLFGSSQSAVAVNTATLSVLSGTVQIVRAGESERRSAADGMSLQTGDQVFTQSDGHALITLIDGSTIELEPGTSLTIQNLSGGASAPAATLRQTSGNTWSRVVALADSTPRFQLETPTAVIGVRGTLFRTAIETNPQGVLVTLVESYEGVVDVSAQGTTVSVTAGRYTRVASGQPPEPSQPIPAPRSQLGLAIYSPAWLLVVDPAGRSLGLVPPGYLANQIPKATADGSGAEPQGARLNDPVGGAYQVYLFGTAAGNYLVTADATTENVRHLAARHLGQIRPGDRLVADLTLTVNGGVVTGAEMSDFRPLTGEPIGKVVKAPTLLERAVGTATALAQSFTDRDLKALQATAQVGQPTASPAVPSTTATATAAVSRTAPPATATSATASIPTEAPPPPSATAQPVIPAATQPPPNPTPVPPQPASTATPVPPLPTTPPVQPPTFTPAPPRATEIPPTPRVIATVILPPEVTPTPRVIATFVVPAEGITLTPEPRAIATVAVPNSTPVPETRPAATPTPGNSGTTTIR